MKRITIRRGELSKSFVLVKPPYPKVGDAITLKGNGSAEWTVVKLQLANEAIAIRFPRAQAFDAS